MQITLIDCIIPLCIGCCRDFPYLPAGQSLIEMAVSYTHLIIYLAPLVGFILVVLRSVQTISFRIGALRAEKRGDTA